MILKKTPCFTCHLTGDTGFEMVLRDSWGKILLSALLRSSNINRSLMAEILAIKHGLELVVSRNYRHLIVESDAMLAINYLDQSGRELIFDILDAVSCDSCVFQHANRVVNRLAHDVSKLGGERDVLMVWEESLPPSIL